MNWLNWFESEEEEEEEEDSNWLKNEKSKWDRHTSTTTPNEYEQVSHPKIDTVKVMPNGSESECLNVLGETLKSKVTLISLFILVAFYVICSVAIILSLIIIGVVMIVKAMIAICKFYSNMKKVSIGII